VLGKGKDAEGAPADDKGAVRGASGTRVRRGGVWGSARLRDGRARVGVFVGVWLCSGSGEDGRVPTSVVSSQMGNTSSVAERCGLRRGMCERTGSEREREESVGEGNLGMGMGNWRRLLGAGAALNGSGDGWRRLDGAAWEELRCCCWCTFLPCCRPRISAAGFNGVTGGSGVALDAACAFLGLGEPLLALGGLDKVKRPGVRVGWTTAACGGADGCLRWEWMHGDWVRAMEKCGCF
jgi:hypothetical protein